MNKSILLVICIFAIAATMLIGAAAFTDIEDETTEQAVSVLESMGIVTGTSKTKYSPSLILTRSQVCAMMIRTMGYESAVESYVNQKLFTDVKSNAWYSGYVNLAYKQGIISGYGNGKFGPEDEITYGQFVTIILRLLGYTDSDIGKSWPADYIVFAADIDLDENISLGANDKVSRGDAAILLYNAVMASKKGDSKEYYRHIGGYASEVSAIILDNAVEGATSGDLYACVIGSSAVEMKYYSQKNKLPDAFVGNYGTILLNSADKVIGFIPGGDDYADIIIDSAKISGVTDTSGNTYRINNSVGVISDGNIYTYGTTGYVKVNSHSNGSARFYYDNDGAVIYIYLTSGVDIADTVVAVATSGAAATEFEEVFKIASGEYSVVKNGSRSKAEHLAAYDTAYYDNMTETLYVSDRKVTGYIESASPSVSAAEVITLSGCEISVLECAWDSLSNFKFGDRITVFLTDNNYVAAAVSAEVLDFEMYGVLSTDTNTVTLVGSGLEMKPSDISAKLELGGSLVKVDTTDADVVRCTAVAKIIKENDVVDVKNSTVCGILLSPGCSVYEWGGKGYVYSLDGEMGKGSSDLSDIYWAELLDSTYVSFYHVNSAGMVDVLLLTNVTGNYYEYGYLTVYKDEKGVSISENVSYNGLTLKNDDYPNESKKYICTVTKSSGYGGVAVAIYNESYSKVAEVVRLKVAENISASNFYLNANDEWYASVDGAKIPVSDKVKIYVEPTGKWMSGEEGLLKVLASELTMSVQYDRSLENGAQIRLIIAK